MISHLNDVEAMPERLQLALQHVQCKLNPKESVDVDEEELRCAQSHFEVIHEFVD